MKLISSINPQRLKSLTKFQKSLSTTQAILGLWMRYGLGNLFQMSFEVLMSAQCAQIRCLHISTQRAQTVFCRSGTKSRPPALILGHLESVLLPWIYLLTDII